MAISPDETRIATGLQDGSIRIRAMTTGDQLVSLPTGLSAIRSLHWSPEGDVLVATGEDDSLRTWATMTWKQGANLAGNVADLDTWDIDPSVDRIASVDGRNILLHDTRTGDFIFTLRDHDVEVTQLAFSPDGNRLISIDGNGRLKIWNTLTRSQAAARRQQQAMALESPPVHRSRPGGNIQYICLVRLSSYLLDCSISFIRLLRALLFKFLSLTTVLQAD